MSPVKQTSRVAEPAPLIIKNSDYQRLLPLLRHSAEELAEALEEELSRAEIVADQDLPPDAVALNARVTFCDVDAAKDTTVTLVFPDDANLAEQKLSVLSPVGVALLGLRTHGSIRWPVPNGKHRHLKIVSVTQNPAGDDPHGEK